MDMILTITAVCIAACFKEPLLSIVGVFLMIIIALAIIAGITIVVVMINDYMDKLIK